MIPHAFKPIRVAGARMDSTLDHGVSWATGLHGSG